MFIVLNACSTCDLMYRSVYLFAFVCLCVLIIPTEFIHLSTIAHVYTNEYISLRTHTLFVKCGDNAIYSDLYLICKRT